MYAKGQAIPISQQGRTLDQVLNRSRAVGPAGVVVFDLDSTLLDNRPRQARILREFGEERGIPALAACGPEHWSSWEITEAMRAAGLDARQAAALASEAKVYWRQRFFTSAYCMDDRPIAGAAEFLGEVRATQAQVAYVTGRHVAMGEGSIASFRASGFPLPGGGAVHLLLKPTFEMGDDAWKQEAYARLDRLGQVIAAFDNEPAHINGYAERYPEALAVHLVTDHSGRPITVHPRVPAIANFTRVR